MEKMKKVLEKAITRNDNDMFYPIGHAKEGQLRTPRYEIRHVRFEGENGSIIDHKIVHSVPSVAVLIFDENNNVATIKQFRSTIGKYCIEIPAGCYDSEKDNSILETARREVEEEAGLLTESIAMLTLGPSFLDPSKSDEDYGVAMARCIGKCQRNLDDDEQIDEKIEWIPIDVLLQMLLKQDCDNASFNNMQISGHTAYALKTYFFQKTFGAI